jgi:hypothetical protein
MIFVFIFVLGLAIVIFMAMGGSERFRKRQNPRGANVVEKPPVSRAPDED